MIITAFLVNKELKRLNIAIKIGHEGEAAVIRTTIFFFPKNIRSILQVERSRRELILLIIRLVIDVRENLERRAKHKVKRQIRD